MKTSKFTETQIVAILKQKEVGQKVADICREHGIRGGPQISDSRLRWAGPQI